MKDLKCGLTACKHNKGYCCCAKAIDVDRYADCTSYEPEKKRTSMFEAGSDFVKANYNVDTEVHCTANCIFNKNNKCYSGGITVMSEDDKPACCLTYVKG